MDTTRQFASQIRVGFQEQAQSNVVCSDSEVHSFKLTLRETIRAKERKEQEIRERMIANNISWGRDMNSS